MATVNTTWVLPVGATLDKATGGTIDETMTDAIASDLYHLGGIDGFIGCKASMTSAQSVADITTTTLAMAGESFDSAPGGAMHDNVTSNSRVVARVTGLYHLSGFVDWASNATGYRSAQLWLNNASIIVYDYRAAVNGNATGVTIYAPYYLTAGDYIELKVYQTSGGALNAAAGHLSVIKA